MGLEYRCFGEGNEIFVLENGIGRSMYEWYPIAKELAKSGKVVLYHRAGYGKSVCSEKKRTIGQIAEELRELLNQLEIHQPVILAGYEFGGLCVQQFARKYKEMVKSIIVMDSMTASYDGSNGTKTVNPYQDKESEAVQYRLYAEKTEEELSRMLLIESKNNLSYLDEEEQKEYRSFLTNPVRYETMAREIEALKEAEEASNTESFSELAVNVMVHDPELGRKYLTENGFSEEEAAQAEKEWFQIQLSIASQSPYGRLIYAENAGPDLRRDAFDLIVRTISHEAARNPKEAISYCGINCYLCPIFLATVTADREQKEMLAKSYSTDSEIFTSEDICCDGCGTRRSSYSKMCGSCQIKACAISKLSDLKNETCADCSQYPCSRIDTYVSKENRHQLDCIANKKML